MPIRNCMEELVLRIVDELCDEDAASEHPSYCTSPDCRQDVACFVLNRVPQRYVSSARGQAHVDKETHEDLQLRIDVVTLTHEGLRRVTSVRRSYYDTESGARPIEGPVYALPILKGRLFNGLTFQPVSDIQVQLRLQETAVEMIDNRWQNPYVVNDSTPGTFIFLPRPIQAEKSDHQGSFEFEIYVEDDQYEPFHHFFTVGSISKTATPDLLDVSADFRLPDLYLLPAV